MLPASRVMFFALIVAGLSCPPLSANTIAISNGRTMATNNSRPVAGTPGSVCAIAYTGIVQPAGATGSACSDQSAVYPGLRPRDMTLEEARAIGRAYRGPNPNPPRPYEYFERLLIWKFDNDADKIGDAMAAGGMLTFGIHDEDRINKPNSMATALQTATSGVFGGVTGTATAMTNIQNARPPVNGFASGFVHDPVLFGLADSTQPGAVTFSIDPGLVLQATDPGDFAEAYWDLSIGSQLVLSFDFELTSRTSALDSTFYNCFVFALDPSGCAAFPNYFTNTLLPTLAFDAANHEVTNTSSATLLTLLLPAGSDPVTVTFDYHALAVSGTPEPTTLALLAPGILGAWIAIKRRMR